MSGRTKECDDDIGVAGVLLMHPSAKVTLPLDAEVLPDLRSRARVLRLLALGKGQFFNKYELAEIFEMREQSVAPMIDDLRKRLGGPRWGRTAIETRPGVGYGLRPDRVHVDAHQFRSLLEQLRVPLHIGGLDDLTPQSAADALELLDAALAMWRGNPARGLENVVADEHRYYTVWEQHHHDARRLRTLCALRVGTMAYLRDAILQLQREVDPKQLPDNEPWCLLIRAYFSTGNQDMARRTYFDARDYYRNVAKQPLPHPIEECFQRTAMGDSDFGLLRRITPTVKSDASDDSSTDGRQPADTASASAELVDVMSKIGISTATELRLQGSHMEPRQCMGRVDSLLWFTGVLASKWVADPAVRSQLDDLLTVLDDDAESDVRFMIMNPDGPGYERLHALRKGRLSSEHIPHLARLAKNHRSLQVRVFDHLPSFRIVVVDRDVVTFSFYRLDESSYLSSDGGWDSPHIVLDPLAPWPLAAAFTSLFEESWEQATPLDPERYL